MRIDHKVNMKCTITNLCDANSDRKINYIQIDDLRLDLELVL